MRFLSPVFLKNPRAVKCEVVAENGRNSPPSVDAYYIFSVSTKSYISFFNKSPVLEEFFTTYRTFLRKIILNLNQLESAHVAEINLALRGECRKEHARPERGE